MANHYITNKTTAVELKYNDSHKANEKMKSNRPINEEEDEKKAEYDSAAPEASAAKSMVCDGGNDCEDAASSSGSEPPSSSSQGTSGGAGYSGDYSSISDSSETGGSQSKPKAVRDGRGGKKISEPILKNKGGTYASTRVRRQKRPNKSMDGVNAHLPGEDRSNEHIRHYHHHRNHHGGHRHHQATGSNVSSLYSQDANSDEDINLDINRKISEIMSLYKVSLHAQRDIKNAARANLKLNAEAAAKQAAEAKSSGRPLQVENSQPQNVLAHSQRTASSAQKMASDQDETHGHSGHMDSSECYTHLVEACRPFFNDSRTLMSGEQPPTAQANAGIDEAHSSSGFTSFFTTTNQSGSNSNNTNGSGGSSNDSKSLQATETTKEIASQTEQEEQDNDTSSETSSLVVQARVKRKYKDQSRRTSSSNSDQTNNNQKGSENNSEAVPSKRVRIETVALNAAKSKEKTKSKQQQQRTESSSLTSSLSASTEKNSAPKAQAEEGESNHSQATSTSAKPVVVTESSSGTNSANNSSGSGTGSGNDNNTTSKSESGGDGNSDQQKLPGDRDSTESEAGAGQSQGEKQKPGSSALPIAKADKPLIHHHHHRNEKKSQETSIEGILAPAAAAAERQDKEDALVSKEKRLEKKRKRRESRREYEEELRQTRDSSENNSDAALEPGMPVTLEEVLCITKTARLLVQALPPFLAVHINAAFTNLCGIQSSSIIGRPAATFISLPSSKEGESSGSDNANSREESDKMSSLSGSADDTCRNGSCPAIASGGDAAATAGDANFQNLPSPLAGLRIDRLIVARGYGHIHTVELECHRLLQDQHSHAIEGSEVKFIEGNNPSKRRKKAKPKLLCRMSVSPVVSSSARTEPEIQPVKGTDSNGGNKRRKHKHPAELQSVKHYLIQLEAVNGPRSLVSGSSSTSCATDTTLEAQLLGITKAEVHARRCRLETLPNRMLQTKVSKEINEN
ncbi:hypothetical protein QTG54_000344 [Skeletonema marinoi]|uniref:Uncharacterized protein n=1 Tax=Skeletonema marinoi TaxID=267567 RepID=A0AAD8YN86_9STRA|nr:hypothetical protein QTG54_000344 [Skeletonema marinoi]